MRTVVIARALTLCALAVSCGVPASADAKSDERAIRGLYARLEATFKARNVKAMDALSTDDFTEKSPGMPTLTKKQSTAMMVEQFKMLLGTPQVAMVPDKITIKGDSAEVLSHYRFASAVKDAGGQMGPKGKVHKISETGTSRELLVRTKGGWKFKSHQTLTQNSMVDGKRFNPMAAAGGGAGQKPPKK